MHASLRGYDAINSVNLLHVLLGQYETEQVHVCLDMIVARRRWDDGLRASAEDVLLLSHAR